MKYDASRQPIDTMKPTLRIPANVVPYLRSGVIAAHGSALDLMMIQHEREHIDEAAWGQAHRFMNSARRLLDRIGVAAVGMEFDVDVELEDGEASLLVLEALIAIHDVEVMRVQDAATERVRLSNVDIAALASFIDAAEPTLDATGEIRRARVHRVVDRAPRPVRRPDRQ